MKSALLILMLSALVAGNSTTKANPSSIRVLGSCKDSGTGVECWDTKKRPNVDLARQIRSEFEQYLFAHEYSIDRKARIIVVENTGLMSDVGLNGFKRSDDFFIRVSDKKVLHALVVKNPTSNLVNIWINRRFPTKISLTIPLMQAGAAESQGIKATITRLDLYGRPTDKPHPWSAMKIRIDSKTHYVPEFIGVAAKSKQPRVVDANPYPWLTIKSHVGNEYLVWSSLPYDLEAVNIHFERQEKVQLTGIPLIK